VIHQKEVKYVKKTIRDNWKELVKQNEGVIFYTNVEHMNGLNGMANLGSSKHACQVKLIELT